VREDHLLEQPQLLPLADADRGGGPLADPVQGQDRGLVERRRVVGARRVRLVVLGEEDLLGRSGAATLHGVLDLGRDPELLAQPERHRHHVRAQAAGDHRQVGLQDAVELEQRLVVEDHPVQRLAGRDAALREAVAHRVEREARVVLLAGEPLLLSGGDDAAVHHQAGGRVVVVTTDPEELHGPETAS
jgi:hypothetical protein